METETEEGTEQFSKVMSHNEVMEYFKDAMAEIIVGDPYLQHLSTRVTNEEIQAQIALEHGQAITVFVRRADDSVLPIVVLQNATVLDLKHGLCRFFKLKHLREDSGTLHISWRSVWKRYWLYFNGQKLTENNRKLSSYGINNRDEIQFIKKLRQK